eukprot:GEMP01051372.1.p1 GENE.GEMP01051372.1~~GEMP01051372.1.p1  ORF type:complete len:304 (+),score=67.82 GEMP01051372.1:382-1293(+)
MMLVILLEIATALHFRGSKCPVCTEPVAVGKISTDSVIEASGLTMSRLFPDIFYTMNDTPEQPAIFALRKNGSLVATYTLDIRKEGFGVTGWGDWESLAMARCTDSERHCFYVADSGHNCVREKCPFLRKLAPSLIQFSEPTSLRDQLLQARRQPFAFPNNQRFDAEALLAHDDRLWLLTKENDSQSHVFAFPAFGANVGTAPLQLTLEAMMPLKEGTRIVGACGRCGRGIAVRTSPSILWFPTSSFPSTIPTVAQRCELPESKELRGEAIVCGESREGNAFTYLTLSEGTHQHIYETTCTFP